VIDVAFTADGLRAADVAVVIDVLRATSTATQALAAGYRQVLCVGSVESARDLRSPGRVLAGERHCVKPPGFDQGNSPSEARRRRGDELVLATTNGAPAIVAAAACAPTVLLACLLNLDAVVVELLAREAGKGSDLQVVCSGTDGAVALEDVYVAGRLIARLRGARTDAALVAEAVARAFPTPLDALAASADAAALRAAGLTADIADCARESQLDVLPAVVGTSGGIAIVAMR
jgi:2-phosphosulfolactate phosphatase